MGIERKPDFVANSKGEVYSQRDSIPVSELNLPDLFNQAGVKGDRDSEEFLDALVDLLVEKNQIIESKLGSSLTKPDTPLSDAGLFSEEIRKIVEKEGVRWELFKVAWNRSLYAKRN